MSLHLRSHVVSKLIKNSPPTLIARALKLGEHFVFLQGEENLNYLKLVKEETVWSNYTLLISFKKTFSRVNFVFYDDQIPIGQYSFNRMEEFAEFWIRDFALSREKVTIEILHA